MLPDGEPARAVTPACACDPARFAWACTQALAGRDGGIGTLGEKSVHAALKYYFAPDPATHERPIGRAVADIASPNGVIEIQSRQFYRLQSKLAAFLPEYPVTVVYPVIRRKRIRWFSPDTGELLETGAFRAFRKDVLLLAELYGIRAFLPHPNLRVCIAALEAEDLRLRDGFGAQKRIHATKMDRIPTQLLALRFFCRPANYAVFLPDALPDPFDSAAFAAAHRIPRDAAHKALRVLEELGLLTVQRSGRNNQYYRNTSIEKKGQIPHGTSDSDPLPR